MPKSTIAAANTTNSAPITTTTTTSIKQKQKKKKKSQSSKLSGTAVVIKKPEKKKSKSKSRARKLNRAIISEQVSKVSAIKRASFARQVKLALSAHNKEGGTPFRITPKAIAALQEAAEQHLVERFGDALAIANRHDKLTPTDVDLRLVCSLKPVVGNTSSIGAC